MNINAFIRKINNPNDKCNIMYVYLRCSDTDANKLAEVLNLLAAFGNNDFQL